MIGMALANSIYAVLTSARTVALVCEHAALSFAIAGSGDAPSVYACYRLHGEAPCVQRRAGPLRRQRDDRAA
jgi:hypothetical protein